MRHLHLPDNDTLQVGRRGLYRRQHAHVLRSVVYPGLVSCVRLATLAGRRLSIDAPALVGGAWLAREAAGIGVTAGGRSWLSSGSWLACSADDVGRDHPPRVGWQTELLG